MKFIYEDNLSFSIVEEIEFKELINEVTLSKYEITADAFKGILHKFSKCCLTIDICTDNSIKNFFKCNYTFH